MYLCIVIIQLYYNIIYGFCEINVKEFYESIHPTTWRGRGLLDCVVKLILLVLLGLTGLFYFLPLIENADSLVDVVSAFEPNMAWVESLYLEVAAVLTFGRDLMLLMIFEVMCIIALKKDK